MKKVLYSIAAMSLLLLSCEKESHEESLQEQSVQQSQEIDMSDFYVYVEDGDYALRPSGETKGCFTMQVLKNKLDKDPKLYNKMYAIEKQLRSHLYKKGGNGNGNGNGGGKDGGGDTGGNNNLGAIDIPVIVHVLYNSSQENISDAQINSQIQVLNNDFSASNNDINNVPSEFSGVVADADINFSLAQVIRKQSSRDSWGNQ